MKPKQLLEVLHQAHKLKTTYRHCFFDENRQESVADHSWRMALMAMLMENEIDCDMNKVIKMCLIHDLGETFTGDIPTFIKTEEDGDYEDQLVEQFIHSWGIESINNLLEEMVQLETKEAKIYKAIDKMEAVISHNESDLSTWLPLEYDLQYTYGRKEVECDDYMKLLKEEIDKESDYKIKNKV